MKKYSAFILVFLLSWMTAQEVKLTVVEKEMESDDVFLYRIDNTNQSVYLGELEVNGFSNKDAEVFTAIYHTAKQIGANTFRYQPIVDISGEIKAFNPHHYKLQLYYTDKTVLEYPKNQMYVFGNSHKDLKIRINKTKVKLPSRTYYKLALEEGKEYTIATSSFLGTSMRFTASEEELSKYYQLFTNTLEGNQGFLGFKTADIKVIEKSYADFLLLVYKENH